MNRRRGNKENETLEEALVDNGTLCGEQFINYLLFIAYEFNYSVSVVRIYFTSLCNIMYM